MRTTPCLLSAATSRSFFAPARTISHGLVRCLATLAMVGGLTGSAWSDETLTVPGTANIYGAGHSSPPPAGFGGSGELPQVVNFAAAAGQTLEIVSATGTVLLDQPTNNAGLGPSGPDGGPFYSPTDVTSTGGLSGIKSNVTGFLTGVFLDDSEPTGGGPAVLDFTTSGLGTNFTTLTPSLGQVFFIGDGVTSSGAVQRFQIPATATRLFLGIVDAADGDNAAGPPQAYGDNGGSFSATVRIDSKVNRIVYINGSGNLIMMDADGGNKLNLTSGAFYAEMPELSADGKYVAFRGTRASPTLSGIWVMKAEPVGAGNVPVLVSSNSNYGYNLSWHPDGRLLALGEYVTSSPTVTVLRVRDTVGTITPEGAGNVAVRMLTRNSEYYYSGGNFSPDGRYLAVSNKGKQIFLLAAVNSSGELTPESATNPVAKVGILDSNNSAGTPEWSPDARSVVFPQITVDASTSRLAVLKVRNEAGAPLAEGTGNLRVNYTQSIAGIYNTVSPSWSADGTRIAFGWSPDNVAFYNTYTILASGPEDNSTNPKVMLTSNAEFGTLTPSFAAARLFVSDPIPTYGVTLTGLKNGQLLPPKTTVELKANISPAPSAGVTIKKVQFYLNGSATGSADTTAPYNYSSLVESAGERTITAVATDNFGGTVTSAPLKFTVTPAGAGQIALQTEILPAGTTFAPGQLVTYRLIATNTSKSAVAKGVKIVAPVPQRTKYNKATAYDENGTKLSTNPKVSADKKEVTFDLGNIPVGKARRAELVVRVPFDAAPGGDPVRNTKFNITGTGFGDQTFKGNFAVVSRSITGIPPYNSPRLSMVKAVVDFADDKNDELDMIEDPKLGSIVGAAPGDVLSFLLVVSNYGGLPAEKVSITERIPTGCKLVAKSARVNDVSAGGLLTVDGRTLKFQLGDLPANKIVVIKYQISIIDSGAEAPSPGATVYSGGAEVGAMNLEARVDSAPERIYIRIEKPAEMRVEHLAQTGVSEVGKPTSYVLQYRNEGGSKARNFKIINPIPDGTKYKSAVIRNKKGEQKIDLSKSNTVAFNLGDIPAEGSGEVELTVDVKSTVLSQTYPSVVNQPYLTTSSAAAVADAKAAGPETFAAETKGYVPEDSNPVADTTRPRFAITRIAPQSVEKGDQFTYQIILGNTSDIEVGANTVGGIVFQIPAGAEYLSSSAGLYGTTGGKPTFSASFHHFTGNPAVKFPANGAKSITILLRATGDIDTPIIDSSLYVYSKGSMETYALPSTTLIIDGPASSPTNQAKIAAAQLGIFGASPSVALLDDRVAKAVGKINSRSISTTIAGASYLQATSGHILMPLRGNDQMLVIGPASLIGNDGSTLIGNDGSTLVAAGGGNLITLNGLIGNDGSTLIGNDGSTIMAKIRAGDASNLVAAGGMNLVAAGGGNLVSYDGAFLVGNDGASLFPVSNLLSGINAASLVAAGGGNILDAGKGLLSAAAASAIINNPASLVNSAGGIVMVAGGANLVAAGGLNQPTPDGFGPAASGGNVLSRDKSVAISYNLDGSITLGGGGTQITPSK
ncbi:MAG: Ig-like domain-containing protein [Verrucomicrobiota bacterium]